jgi:hypothetical protein
MSEDIKDIQNKISAILREAGVLRSSVFGSTARGEARPDSDVDILVDLPNDKSLFDLIDLQEKISKQLGKKVDIGTYRSIKSSMKDKILKEQVVIYER